MLIANSSIDDLYRPVAYPVLKSEDAAHVMSHVLQEEQLAPYPKPQIYKFVEWAVQHQLLPAPVFPEIPSEVFLYYRAMCGAINNSLDIYRKNMSGVLALYKQLHPEESNLQIVVPDGPSTKWLSVMEPTSIAMGHLKAAKDIAFGRLSPAGVVWRAESVKGLVESLQYAGKNPVFAAYCLLQPEVLPRYFMYCHPIVYFSGQVGFTNLPQSDVALITEAAVTGFGESPMEIIKRAIQLFEKSLEHPCWKTWERNLARGVEAVVESPFRSRHDADIDQDTRERLSAVMIGRAQWANAFTAAAL